MRNPGYHERRKHKIRTVVNMVVTHNNNKIAVCNDGAVFVLEGGSMYAGKVKPAYWRRLPNIPQGD